MLYYFKCYINKNCYFNIIIVVNLRILIFKEYNFDLFS